VAEPKPAYSRLARVVEALLFLSPQPVSSAELVEATDASEAELDRAIDQLRGELAEGRRGCRPARGWPEASPWPPTPRPRRPRGRLLAKPRTPPLTRAQAENPGDRRLPATGLAPGDRPHPRRLLGIGGSDSGRAGTDRGVGPLALRRSHLPHHRAVRESCSDSAASTSFPIPPASTRRPRTSASFASGCCGPASSAPLPEHRKSPHLAGSFGLPRRGSLRRFTSACRCRGRIAGARPTPYGARPCECGAGLWSLESRNTSTNG